MSDACVLDTHAWQLSLTAPDRLPRPARRTVDRSAVRYIAAISMWEAALLSHRQRVRFTEADEDFQEWLTVACAEPQRIAPLSPEIAVAAAQLDDEGFHRDPADRLIYATARVLDVPLVTRDSAIHAFEAGLPRRARRLAIWA